MQFLGPEGGGYVLFFFFCNIVYKGMGASHGNLPHVGITGDQVTLTQIGIQVTAR
jgi:hypothetical protein